MRGDMDADNEITVADAQDALKAYVRHLASQEFKMDAESLEAGDVDRDGELTVMDAQLILRYYVINTLVGVDISWDVLIAAMRLSGLN